MTEQLWNIDQAADFLGKARATLYDWSYKGIGPPVLRVMGGLRYDPDRLKAWAADQEKVPGVGR